MSQNLFEGFSHKFYDAARSPKLRATAQTQAPSKRAETDLIRMREPKNFTRFN